MLVSTTTDRYAYLKDPRLVEDVRTRDRYTDATDIAPLEAVRPDLDEYIRQQCRRKRIPEPWQIAVVDSSSPHGTARQDGIVLLGRKLLDLPDKEVMALVGHELHHMQKHSTRNHLFRGCRIMGNAVHSLFSPLEHIGLERFVPSWAKKDILRVKLQNAYMRDEEYQADEAGGRFVGSMETMARALEHIDTLRDLSELKITPFLKEQKADLSHPFLDDRLTKLYEQHRTQGIPQLSFAH